MISYQCFNKSVSNEHKLPALTQPAFTCSKLTIETLEQGVKRRSGVFIVNFEHISHLVLVFLLLTLNMQLPAGKGLTISNRVLSMLRIRRSIVQILMTFCRFNIHVSQRIAIGKFNVDIFKINAFIIILICKLKMFMKLSSSSLP